MNAAFASGSQLSRLRLLQLCSPTLPIGAFAYSQGLEQAIEQGWIENKQQLQDWLSGLLQRPLAHTDLPLLARAVRVWEAEHAGDQAVALSAVVFALRETKELREEERHLGSSLARLLDRLGIADAAAFVGQPHASYLVMYGLAVARWHIPVADALAAFAFAWLENQIAAASRLMPLGQLDAQAMLSELMLLLPELARNAEMLDDDELGQTVPAFALASSWHEQQYSRLFRS